MDGEAAPYCSEELPRNVACTTISGVYCHWNCVCVRELDIRILATHVKLMGKRKRLYLNTYLPPMITYDKILL